MVYFLSHHLGRRGFAFSVMSTLLLLLHLASAQTSSRIDCRICGDDSFLPEPFRPVVNLETNRETVCANIEAMANDGVTSEDECATFRNNYESICCAITEPPPDDGLIFCPICRLPGHAPQDPLARFDMGGSVPISCETAVSLTDTLRLPPPNCTAYQNLGKIVCECAETPRPANDCMLCQDGSDLPQPLRLVNPANDDTCLDIEVEAKRADPNFCSDYQQTYGDYCGCDTSPPPQKPVCRLCGGTTRLPRQLQLIPLVGDAGEELTKTCGRLEWEANAIGNCENYQDLYGGKEDGCCEGAVVGGTGDDGDDDDDDGAGGIRTTRRTMILLLLSVLLHPLWMLVPL